MTDKILKYTGYLMLHKDGGLTKSGMLNLLISSVFLPLVLLAIDLKVLVVWTLVMLLLGISVIISIIIEELAN